MTMHLHALRTIKKNNDFKNGDVLVLFGELFNRGYANGLVEEAQKRGLKIIHATVGRRDAQSNQNLRPLTLQESAAIPKPFINVPLEAGFDFEPAGDGKTPVDQLKEAKLSNWHEIKLNQTSLLESQKSGHERFKTQIKTFVKELEQHIPSTSNVIFAHLMAGGVPRSKIIMSLMNRVVKGTGERHLDSEGFWNSDMGKLCALNFIEVTANTFDLLVQETTALRENIQKRGNKVSYLAYGYHGTEVLFGNNYIWQSYTPYLQGWAKLQLENYSDKWSKRGVTCCVYNCPEILTNSSGIFQGVEISLYPLVESFRKENPNSAKTIDIIKKCEALLKPECSMPALQKTIQSYLTNSYIRELNTFEKWPQHNTKTEMELMLSTSDQIFEMHKNPKELMSFPLSEIVFSTCGQIMINHIAHPDSPVAWIGHDIVAKTYLEKPI